MRRRLSPLALPAVLVLLLLSLVAVTTTAISCAHPPPTASPVAKQEFYDTRVIKTLDLIMETAQDAAAQPEPYVSEDSARRITNWQQTAVKIIVASTSGWKDAVLASLNETFDYLKADEQARLAPYFALAKTILAETQP